MTSRVGEDRLAISGGHGRKTNAVSAAAGTKPRNDRFPNVPPDLLRPKIRPPAPERVAFRALSVQVRERGHSNESPPSRA